MAIIKTYTVERAGILQLTRNASLAAKVPVLQKLRQKSPKKRRCCGGTTTRVTYTQAEIEDAKRQLANAVTADVSLREELKQFFNTKELRFKYLGANQRQTIIKKVS